MVDETDPLAAEVTCISIKEEQPQDL